ncbi:MULTISPECIES: nucleotide exchange factor GrpE [Microbacterium]|uniref:Protein GrpE n=1 Tax=Microbacterium aquilitoris TaxID=3067307 RepID=A0ABU3GFT9_9MICO|nr:MULTISPECIES: nucleotide exchange factor GrpE [unclassified Microbacterium]MDT3329205.1 nucleotide exchange factor GrpE [Microbacterium sp. KSW-18]MDT3345048.1 nucleotide exchange factor GrpE [Microbacterium sp. KSW2-22]
MADKDFEKPDEGDDVAATPAEESVEPAGDADTEPDALTVDDILGAAQSDEAAVADAPEEEHDLLLDLKRVQAEYANYRRRTEEQREVELARAKGAVAKGMLPVLDDLDRAEKHGDLAEGSALAAIAEKMRAVVARLGVERYGAAGDAFDPQQHEAIFQAPTPGTTEPTILEVVEIGYRLGDLELRPAKVVVAVPAE